MSGKLCDGLELGPLPLLCVLFTGTRTRGRALLCWHKFKSKEYGTPQLVSATVLIADRECLGWLFPRVQIYHLSI